MTIEEKLGLMWHPPIGAGSKGEVLGKSASASYFFGSSSDLILNKNLKTFNLFTVPDTRTLATWYNNLQKVAEQDRLGTPITISSDPGHGINNFISGDLPGGDWSEPIGLAATDDSLLVVELGQIAAKELTSTGIRAALHPMADLATEPRWSRINGSFAADADLSKKLTVAYIYGFHGERLGSESVATMVKHWTGGGPQKEGWAAHFRYGAEQAYPGKNSDYHLKPFAAAFEAGTAMLMPY
jgi:beta-glucosidase